jgi:ankyrin repeat protein
LLLDAGADINSKCGNGRTPLSYAPEGGNPQVIGADRTIRDCEGGSALLAGHFGAEKNYEDVIALLKTELFGGMTRQQELTGT